jgi:predicted nucleotidyltransferase
MYHDTGSELGLRVKELRRRSGLTAAALARCVGVTENAIRKIESGASKEPRFSTGLRIARALGVEPAAILGNTTGENEEHASPDLARILRSIRDHRSALEREGVEHVSVFGSTARGEPRAGSDVDVILEPSGGARFSLFNLAAAVDILEAALGCPVDAVTRKTIEGAPFATAVEAEAVNAF